MRLPDIHKYMDKAIKCAILGCLVALFVLICCLVVVSAHFDREEIETQAALRDSLKDLPAVLTDVRRTVEIIGGTANEIRQIARDNKKSTDTIAAQSVITSQRVNLLLSDVANTNRTVDSLIRDIHLQFGNTADNTNKTLLEVRSTLIASQQTLAQATETLKASQATISNQDFAASLAQLNATMGHLNHSSAEVDKTVTYYEKQLTRPMGFWKTVFKSALKVVTVPLR